jgi:hypothetical protein
LMSMKYSRLKTGTIPITAKLLLYTLLIISIISGVVGSSLVSVSYNNSSLSLFIHVLVSLLSGIGFIVIILEVAKRWQHVGGGILLAIALFILLSLPAGFNEELGLFHDYPYLLAPLLVVTISWAVSGAIIIVSGKFLSIKSRSSSGS